ncbi:MAG TPA: hypothetical protein VFT51_12915 [Bacillales bacterium]|nr:hypothetical protein [Bacillales bacterium]
MIVHDDLNPEIRFQIPATKLKAILRLLKENKEDEIKEMKNKIHKYEQKKKAEESFYRSLSPVRKFFTGRPPNHHQAVEYMVHVKERLKHIDQIKQQISELNNAIQHLEGKSVEQGMALPGTIINDVKIQRKDT